MAANPQPQYWTVEEYLAMERNSEHKHEFIDGEIFAMAGASREHTLITGNTLTILNQQLQDTACEVYGSDMRVRVSPTRYTYPDLSLVCASPQFSDDRPGSLLNPLLIIEILSESTEHKDRTIKFRDYRGIPSLQGYILILQDTPHIEQFIRQKDDHWLLSEARGLDSEIHLPTINCKLQLTQVYRRIEFDNLNQESE